MAVDTRSVVITLKLDNSDENDVSEQTNTTKVSNDTDKNGTAKAVAIWAVSNAVQMASSEIVNWAEYFTNKTLVLRDDYIGQRSKSIATTQINRAISSVSTIGATTAAGAQMGGIVGAIIGAVVGTTSVVFGAVRSNLQGQQQQDILIKQLDAQLGFTRSRSGWSTTAASIGEDL